MRERRFVETAQAGRKYLKGPSKQTVKLQAAMYNTALFT
jgi:hypothetical protein